MKHKRLIVKCHSYFKTFFFCHQIRSGATQLSYPAGKCPVLPLEAGATRALLELAVCSPVIEGINGWGDHLCSACPIAAGLEPPSVEVSYLKGVKIIVPQKLEKNKY